MNKCVRCKFYQSDVNVDGVCPSCLTKRIARKRKGLRLTRAAKDNLMRDLGLVRVRGALGGVYYE